MLNKYTDELLEKIEEGLGGPVRNGDLVRFPDDDDFELWHLEGHLDEQRFEELQAGEQPTEDEMAIWREARMEDHGFDAPAYHLVGMWQTTDADGAELFWATLHEDHGEVWGRVGPFRSAEEVERELGALGKLELSV